MLPEIKTDAHGNEVYYIDGEKVESYDIFCECILNARIAESQHKEVQPENKEWRTEHEWKCLMDVD